MNKVERKIEGALKEAAQLHRDGTKATEAVVKAARSHNLNPDMTSRVVEAFNIAKTNSTIPRLKDKTASFDQAILEDVLGQVFKTPSRNKRASAEVEAEEQIEEALLEFEEKKASLPDFSWTANQKIAAAPEDITEVIHQAFGVQHVLRNDLSKAAQARMSAESSAVRNFREVVEFFNTSNNVGKFADFETDVLSEYGEAARPTLDLIYEGARLEARREERGTQVKIGSRYFTPSTAHQLFDGLMESMDSCHATGEALSLCGTDVTEKTAVLSGLINESQGLSPKVASALDLLDFGSKKKKAADDAGPGVGGVANDLINSATKILPEAKLDPQGLLPSIRSGVSGAISGQYQAAHTKAMEAAIKGPQDQVDAEIANVRRQAILSDIVSNDEHISKMPHADIEKAYSALLQLSPDLTLNHSVVTSFLRQAGTNQAVDPFTAAQLVGLQQDLLKNKAYAGGAVPR